jgi:hypothetical protein
MYAHEIRDLPDYRNFAANRLADKRNTYAVRQERFSTVEYWNGILTHFYNYVNSYPEYETKLTSNAPIDKGKYPDYDYASRMTGLFRETVQECERAYIALTELWDMFIEFGSADLTPNKFHSWLVNEQSNKMYSLTEVENFIAVKE